MNNNRNVQLVIGAGSVGTVIAGHLLMAGKTVRMQVRPGRLATYRAVDRLRVIDARDQPVIEQPLPALAESFDADNVGCIYLAVKRHDLPAVLEQLDDQLAPGVTLAPCLNGVGLAQTLSKRFPDNPVAPVTVMFNARVEAPLQARVTTSTRLLIGGNDPAMLHAFDGTGMVVKPANGATEWGKLLLNLNNAVCAATGTGFADLFRTDDLTHAFVQVMDEAIAVFDCADISYELPAPVPYAIYRWLLLRAGWLPLLVARRKNGLSDQAYPSMVADVRQGRTTEIDDLNGVIVTMGREHGVNTTVNETLIALIREFESSSRTEFLTPEQLTEILENT